MWSSEASLAEEYDIEVRVDGTVESNRVLGVVLVGGDRITGERMERHERIPRLMMGKAVHDPVEGGAR